MDRKLSLQIDPASLLRDILRQLLTVVLFSLAAGLFAYVWISFSFEPTYTTKATIAVTNRSTSSTIYSNQYSAGDLATTLSTVLESNIMKEQVMEDLGLKSYNATTTAAQVGETNMIELTVEADSAYHAYAIMKSILNNYTTVSDYLVGSFILEIIEEPTVPYSPSNSVNMKKPVLRVTLLAAAVMLLVIAFLSYSRDTIKNVDQLADKVDAKCLGVIYHERKTNRHYDSRIKSLFALFSETFGKAKKEQAEVAMLINNPMRNFFFVESNKMLASRVRSRMDQEEAKVLLVTSVMENEGKSTVAANIALGIAEEGANVLLIDADFRKPSQYKIFQVGADMKVNLVRFLTDENYTEAPARQYKDTSLYLIANYKHAKVSDTDFQTKDMAAIIDFYKEEMDYIIMDTSPMALVTDTEELARLADASMLVIREDVVLAPHLNDAIDTLNRVGCKVLGCAFNNATRSNLVRTYGTTAKGYGEYYGKYKK